MYLSIATVAAVLFSAAPATEDAIKGDLKKLEGIWHLHGIGRVGGGDQTWGEARGKLVLTKDTFEIWTRPEVKEFKKAAEGKFTINPAVDPKQIDLVDEKDGRKRVLQFCYKIDGDVLIVGDGRFKSWKDDELPADSVIMTYKRAKE